MPTPMTPSDYARECQFIVGRDARGLARFCGRRSRAAASYCMEHYPRIYQRAPVFDPRRLAESAIEAAAARAEVEPEALGAAVEAAEEELEAATAE